MSDRVALKIAIDLIHVPSQVRLFRSEPLPDGVPMLLRIVAGDEEAERTATEITGRSREVVWQAATFFIEQILFAPDANSYRVLGASPQAGADELRRNVALLLRWLHPDLERQGEQSIFIGRVTTAWNNLKTPERRAAYDDLLRRSNHKSKSHTTIGNSKSGHRRNRKRLVAALSRRSEFGRPPMYADGKIGFLRRAFFALFHRPLQ
jgi:hypothetical protein